MALSSQKSPEGLHRELVGAVRQFSQDTLPVNAAMQSLSARINAVRAGKQVHSTESKGVVHGGQTVDQNDASVLLELKAATGRLARSSQGLVGKLQVAAQSNSDLQGDAATATSQGQVQEGVKQKGKPSVTPVQAAQLIAQYKDQVAQFKNRPSIGTNDAAGDKSESPESHQKTYQELVLEALKRTDNPGHRIRFLTFAN